MTLSQCKNKFSENIQKLYTWLKQPVQTTDTDIDEKTVYGFEESVLNLLNTTCSSWNSEKVYEIGDIVERYGEFFISRYDFNTNMDPFTQNYYWIKKEPKTYFTSGNVIAYAVVQNGVLVSSKNVTSLTVINASTYQINLSITLPSINYCAIIGHAQKGTSIYEQYYDYFNYHLTTALRISRYRNCGNLSSNPDSAQNYYIAVYSK